MMQMNWSSLVNHANGPRRLIAYMSLVGPSYVGGWTSVSWMASYSCTTLPK